MQNRRFLGRWGCFTAQTARPQTHRPDQDLAADGEPRAGFIITDQLAPHTIFGAYARAEWVELVADALLGGLAAPGGGIPSRKDGSL